MIPNQNDSNEELEDIAEFLYDINPDIPWHLSAYHPCFRMKALPTTNETLERAYKIGKTACLNYVYVGNVLNLKYESTFCPKCNSCVIQRYGYRVKNFLKSGKCSQCGEKIAGIF